MMKGHLAHHYSHSGLSPLFQTTLSARADLEEPRGINQHWLKFPETTSWQRGP